MRELPKQTPFALFGPSEEIFLSFEENDERYAISVKDVSEIYEYESIRQVPGAPQPIVGLIDVRGKIVTVVNPFNAENARTIALVFHEPYHHLGLSVPEKIGIFISTKENTKTVEQARNTPWIKAVIENKGVFYNLLEKKQIADYIRLRIIESFKSQMHTED